MHALVQREVARRAPAAPAVCRVRRCAEVTRTAAGMTARVRDRYTVSAMTATAATVETDLPVGQERHHCGDADQHRHPAHPGQQLGVGAQ